MTTISEIRNSIKVEDLRTIENEENKKWDEDMKTTSTDAQLISIGFYMIIWNKIIKISKREDTKETRKGMILNTSYYLLFDNEELLNTLRQLYINTKNQFVKKVVKTVGENKRMTEKQATIIIEEMMKYNLTLNF